MKTAYSPKGRRLSKETRAKMCEAQKKRMLEGKHNFYKGHPVSKEIREKVSAAQKGRKQSPETIAKRAKKLIGKTGHDWTKSQREAQSLRLSGMKQSPELIAKRVAARKGYRHSEETKLRMSLAQLAKRPDGFVPKRPIDKHLRTTFEYKNWRRAVFERDDFTCVLCNVRGGQIQADHIKPFALFHELRLDLSNGRTLCIDCHRGTDTYGYKSVKRV